MVRLDKKKIHLYAIEEIYSKYKEEKGKRMKKTEK